MTHEERLQLLKSLDHAQIYFHQKSTLYQQVIDTDQRKQKLLPDLNYYKKNRVIPTLVLVPIFIVMIPVIFALILGIEFLFPFPGSNNFYIGLFCICILLSPVFLSVMNRKLTKSKLENLENRESLLNEQLNDAITILIAHYNAYENPGLLPFKYTYPGMIDILYEYIQDHRANCVTDAINLYLDDAHKRKMEESQVRISRAINDNGDAIRSARNWAAAGTAVSVLGILMRD